MRGHLSIAIPDTTGVLQHGHSRWFSNHLSTHLLWKTCLHEGICRTLSRGLGTSKQITHGSGSSPFSIFLLVSTFRKSLDGHCSSSRSVGIPLCITPPLSKETKMLSYSSLVKSRSEPMAKMRACGNRKTKPPPLARGESVGELDAAERKEGGEPVVLTEDASLRNKEIGGGGKPENMGSWRRCRVPAALAVVTSRSSRPRSLRS